MSKPTNLATPPLPAIAGKRVLIVGAGLIGTSIGLALRNVGVDVSLADVDPDVLAQAVRRGAGEATLRRSSEGTALETAGSNTASSEAEPDLVVIATPPRVVADVAVTALRQYPNATVCDVASSKISIIDTVRVQSMNHGRFIGSHPMAGREVSGPSGAQADLFEDRRWVITPTSANPPDRVELVRALAIGCGAIPVELSPEVHDRAVALTSHTPQLVASALAAVLLEAPAEYLELAGQGLRDTTRIAESDPSLWADILASNAEHIAPILEQLTTDLTEMLVTLRDHPLELESKQQLERVVHRGNLGRRRLPAKHGGTAAHYEMLAVVVADRPGELARLFDAAGNAGVNLEDVRIEHSVGRLNAVIELSVLPGNTAGLMKVLAAGGWRFRGN